MKRETRQSDFLLYHIADEGGRKDYGAASGERFYVVLMSENRNEKYDYYFNQIKDKAERAYFSTCPTV